MLLRLMKDGLIDWYGVLIHDRNSGVPTTADDDNPYFHIRVSFKKDFNDEQIGRFFQKTVS